MRMLYMEESRLQHHAIDVTIQNSLATRTYAVQIMVPRLSLRMELLH